jgi:hypothetical protein
MNKKRVLFTVIAAMLLAWSSGVRADVQVLARIDGLSSTTETIIPVYEYLQDGDGHQYALVLASRSALDASGFSYQVIDADTGTKTYALALRPGRQLAADYPGAVYYNDGKQVIISSASAEAFSQAGYEVKVLTTPVARVQKQRDIPLIRSRGPEQSPLVSVDYNVLIQNIINEVYISNLYQDLGKLSGEQETTVGGQQITIASRHTRYGTPFMKDTEYAYELFDNLGLNPEYHYWEANGYSNRNVIGTSTGQGHPDEIILITAHIDDMPTATYAPGADDNGSGSVGVMTAAEIFSPYTFDRTIRYVLFTGEEQGLLGSSAYADMVYNLGETIVACYNMDMLAWDDNAFPIVDIHTRRTNDAGYATDLAIAETFVDIVNTYGLSNSITAEIVPDAIWASDHSRFWNKGYPAVLAIEDWDDFNAYYHTTNDALRNVNMPYYTAFVKGSLGTCAQIGGVQVPEAAALPALAALLLAWFRKK